MERDDSGMIICPHNMECRGKNAECHKCGWNPEVEKARKKANEKVYGSPEKLYKVPFTGYCEVWATSPEEASEKAEDIPQQFFAHYDFGDPECQVKEEENEVE